MLQTNFPDKLIQGWWTADGCEAQAGDTAIRDALIRINRPIYLMEIGDTLRVAHQGVAVIGNSTASGETAFPLRGYVPALCPDYFGDPIFKSDHRLKSPYLAGAMANAISGVKLVVAMGKAGMMGFFGAGGLTVDRIEAAIHDIQSQLGQAPYGFNLIHSPYSPELERATVDLYLRNGVRCISAAAFLDLTLPLVYYRVKGLHRDANGTMVCPNKVVATVSRVEVARKFFSPPPEKLIAQLVADQLITREEAALSQLIPIASDLTAEADSGGHTDNRSALALLPTMLALRDEFQARYTYQRPLCVGLAGGIATPESTAAAFAMGAAYVVTGTINQACIESGTSDAVRRMLAEASQADVTMTPSADMFEMGVKVQVLKRGTMFALRAAKLYEFYNHYESLEQLPAAQRALLEKTYFHQSCEAEWEQTRQFFLTRDPRQIALAEKDPKHKMALVFRSYLGQSCGWAQRGDIKRQIDYQIWCGPGIGAFNEWSRGTFLEHPENREVVTVAMNLLVGAAVVTRAGWLRSQGVSLPPGAGNFPPAPLSNLREYMGEP
jgi:trans-AT polyketide synthase, acyltransferase and oxidoreductase domains